MSLGRCLGILPFAIVLLTGSALADETVTRFESCFDGRGHQLLAVTDHEQAALVRTVDADGIAEIHYNPSAVPRLTPAARLFFYAGQCARQTLGDDSGQAAARARTADCLGVKTLLDSGTLQRTDLPGLQSELATLSEAEWARLPGPPRSFALTTCPSDVHGILHLPLATTPSPQQSARNACVHGCGDRLWTCQKSCRGDACARCLPTYESCAAACETR